jgi:PhnB protein
MSNDVTPIVAYRNGVEALDWLVAAFGFTEHARMVTDGERLVHAELGAGTGTIMLATPSPDYEGPALHRLHCEASARWQEVPYLVDGLLVIFDDVDVHFLQAEKHGATILTEVESIEHGKRYRAEDLEGHRWMFVERGTGS